jgi:hypothetical protein
MAKPHGLGQWILNVVYLGFQPSEIKQLTYSELQYFSTCHDRIQEGIKRAYKNKGA